MEPLGLLGIIRLTSQILHKSCKHFVCIAFILALPSAFNWIVLGPSSNNAIQYIIASMPIVYKLLHPNSQGQLPELPPSTHQLQPYPLSLLIALFIFSVAVFLVRKPLLTFSVCRACLNQSLDMEGSLRGIPRSVINLVLTALSRVSVLLGFLVVAMVAVSITVAVFSAMNANLAIPIAIWALGLGIAWVYLVVSFSLADTVAILEEKKGWEAMRKSMYLLGGRKWLAFWLSFVFSVCSLMLLIPISALSNEASLLWWWSAAALGLSLQALIALFSMCAHVVLYMSCKSLREEPLVTLIAASAQFGPQKLSAKYADLETAALSSAL